MMKYTLLAWCLLVAMAHKTINDEDIELENEMPIVHM